MKAILPLILGLAGLGGGVVAGHVLREGDEPPNAGEPSESVEALSQSSSEFIALDRQFVVPIVSGDSVGSIMIISLSLELAEGGSGEIDSKEPKLRDRFLSVMFRHAESGAFSGAFTAGPAMGDLRGSLLASAQEVLGDTVRSVLITDIIRQDL